MVQSSLHACGQHLDLCSTHIYIHPTSCDPMPQPKPCCELLRLTEIKLFWKRLVPKAKEPDRFLTDVQGHNHVIVGHVPRRVIASGSDVRFVAVLLSLLLLPFQISALGSH